MRIAHLIAIWMKHNIRLIFDAGHMNPTHLNMNVLFNENLTHNTIFANSSRFSIAESAVKWSVLLIVPNWYCIEVVILWPLNENVSHARNYVRLTCKSEFRMNVYVLLIYFRLMYIYCCCYWNVYNGIKSTKFREKIALANCFVISLLSCLSDTIYIIYICIYQLIKVRVFQHVIAQYENYWPNTAGLELFFLVLNFDLQSSNSHNLADQISMAT